jgi:hypothetical protein
MAWSHARQGMQCEDWQHERTGTRPLVCSWPPASLTKCACQADAARAQHREAGAGAGAAMLPIGNLTVGMTALALADFRTESPSVMPSTASVPDYQKHQSARTSAGVVQRGQPGPAGEREADQRGPAYNESVRPKIYDRMISERRQIAERFLSEGNGEAARIRGNRASMKRKAMLLASAPYWRNTSRPPRLLAAAFTSRPCRTSWRAYAPRSLSTSRRAAFCHC